VRQRTKEVHMSVFLNFEVVEIKRFKEVCIDLLELILYEDAE